jgi:leucyl aminopeptidase
MSADKPNLASHVTPSLQPSSRIVVTATASVPPAATACGIAVGTQGPVPDEIGMSRDRLEALGFDAKVGSTLVVARPEGPVLVAVGVGALPKLDGEGLRDAAAMFARSVPSHSSIALKLGSIGPIDLDRAAQAATEGILLARYLYNPLRARAEGTPLRELALVVRADALEVAGDGARRGHLFAAAQMLARDFANTPHSHLNASLFAEIAMALGKGKGFEVEIFDKDALLALGCGGLLGVNAGSVEPPRMIKLDYRPMARAKGRLAFVGKGIMYDSGGISLKPSDPVHAQMKNDMSGAAAVLAAVSILADLRAPTAVTAYLMCTDNMPSGTAMALGDVLTMRGGTTVEVIDTDAEGRLVMADALALAAEAEVDAIVDIATLTGSCLRALGPDLAGLVGNDQSLVDQVKASAEATGEPVWQLPLYKPYLKMLASGVADLQNCAPVGKPDAILASLFLAEFVGDVPWAHLDICGTAQTNDARTWHPAGCSGFGARLLADLAMRFQPGPPS